MSALPIRTHVSPARGRDVAELPAFLGREIKIKGVLDTDGEIYLYGHVSGRINADRLILNPGGYVEGDVVAREVRVAGRLNGRIFALNVILDSTAEITGRIFHHTVTVEKGARIDARMPWRPLNFFESLEQLPETRP